MSTTTDQSQQTQEEPQQFTHSLGMQLTVQRWFLIFLVFVAGAVSLGVEMAASRLLAPYFGTSLFVWANIIGLILLYLSAGYYLGGRLADRAPRTSVFYAMTAIAALLVGLIPIVASPVLSWSQSVFANATPGEFYGSLVSILILFTLPTILLGCVSPFAIRLCLDKTGNSGRTAGLLYAISTAGSILGTFFPVLVLMPSFGTTNTFFICAGTLLVGSFIGLILSR